MSLATNACRGDGVTRGTNHLDIETCISQSNSQPRRRRPAVRRRNQYIWFLVRPDILKQRESQNPSCTQERMEPCLLADRRYLLKYPASLSAANDSQLGRALEVCQGTHFDAIMDWWRRNLARALPRDVVCLLISSNVSNHGCLRPHPQKSALFSSECWNEPFIGCFRSNHSQLF